MQHMQVRADTEREGLKCEISVKIHGEIWVFVQGKN